MKKVLIRTDASNEIGMGHMNRCVSLSRHLEAEGIESLFLMIDTSDNFDKNHANLGINSFLLEENYSFNEEAHLLIKRFASQYSSIVFDFSHYQNIKRIQDLNSYFELLNDAFQTTFLIDGFNETAIIDRIDPDVDVVITPYIGAVDHSPGRSKGYLHWVGPSYFIFAPEYIKENWIRDAPQYVERLLVTMGGTDPYELTLVVINALKSIPKKINSRIVIGAGFSNDLKDKIRKQCSTLPLCETVDEPNNLVEHLKWAEMAIGASGLTKYEMALAGVPSLQMSFNREMAETTAAYEKKGFYCDLGLYTERKPQEIARNIVNLAMDCEARKMMIQKGQAMFVESGIKRLICAVKDSRIE